MEPQEIFNHVAPQMLRQNKRATDNNNGACVLIAQDNSRCAYGMLLPAEWTYETIYSDDDHIPDTYYESIGVIWTMREGFIQTRLFEIHNYHEPEEWPALLQQAAKDFGLEYGQWNV